MATLTITLSDKTVVRHENLDLKLDNVDIDKTTGVLRVLMGTHNKEGYWYNKDAWLIAQITEEVENEDNQTELRDPDTDI